MADRSVHTVEVPLGDGSDDVVRVQIREVDESLVRVGRGGRAVARAERSLGQMLDTVRPVADSFVGRFRGMVNAPDEVTLEFGVSLSAEADVVIASTATAANFAVTLTWHRGEKRSENRDENPGDRTALNGDTP
ncbi:CU044_2847 family protein [Actinacidiphila glaucinigra]|uniref:CU044_2847 family protein n=1 Tax=Actinacidiphila glaucinigra TaxID=235986 RepID=UPI0029B510F8|nr:CU044_2847 family protein [Streptomyces sp. PA03-3a]